MSAEPSGFADLAAAFVSAVAPSRTALQEYRARVGSIELGHSLTGLVSAVQALAAGINISYARFVAIAWPDGLRPLADVLLGAAEDYLVLLDGVRELNTVRDATAWIDDVNDARLRCVDASNVLRAQLALPAFAMPKINQA